VGEITAPTTVTYQSSREQHNWSCCGPCRLCAVSGEPRLADAMHRTLQDGEVRAAIDDADRAFGLTRRGSLTGLPLNVVRLAPDRTLVLVQPRAGKGMLNYEHTDTPGGQRPLAERRG